MMGVLSILHWTLMFWLILFLPFFWVLKKMGRSPLWGLLAYVPIANIVLFWVAAFWRWPSMETTPEDLESFD
ncbi:MAG: hypothetical protein AAF563_02470 [Pseudomonadota bacterium]